MEKNIRYLSEGDGLRNASSITQLPSSILETFVPGYSIISKFMLESFGFDITFIVSAALLVAGLATAATYAAKGVQWLVSKYFMTRIQVSYYSSYYTYMIDWIAHHKVSRDSRNLLAQTDDDDDWQLEKTQSQVNADGVQSLINFSNREAQRPPRYEASFGTHYFFHKGNLFILSRNEKVVTSSGGYYDKTRDEEVLSISCLGRSSQPLKDLIEETKAYCLGKKKSHTIVRRPASKQVRSNKGGKWDTAMERPSRPIQTVILDQGVKEQILSDINEYLQPSSIDWYSKRGVPYRRGYLLHGPPGTGKSSLAWAIAGIFGLSIHTVSLVDPNLTEEELGMLFTSLPRRCIVLLEDIDTAGLSNRREVAKKGGPTSSSESTAKETAGITLSGLLNAIDGVASHEGHVLIMTTNHPDKLDDALTRPGRIDMKIEFTHATRPQIQELFTRMYSPDIEDTTFTNSKLAKNNDISLEKQLASKIKASPQVMSPLPAMTPPDTPLLPGTPELQSEKSHDLSLEDLAVNFAAELPDKTFTPAEIQGYLLTHKKDAAKAVREVGVWSEKLLASKKEKEAKKDEAKPGIAKGGESMCTDPAKNASTA